MSMQCPYCKRFMALIKIPAGPKYVCLNGKCPPPRKGKQVSPSDEGVLPGAHVQYIQDHSLVINELAGNHRAYIPPDGEDGQQS